MLKDFQEMIDGLAVSRWPLILTAAAIGLVLFFNRDTQLSLAFDLLLIAPAVLGLSFLESKLLWDTWAKRVGMILPDDRYASLALFLGILAANAWIIG